MEGKEVRCTCKFIYSKVILVTGLIAGVLLAILGIVTITADTSRLFSAPLVQWYTTDTRRITFSDTAGFNVHDIWNRPAHYLLFEWTSNVKVAVYECNAKYVPLVKDGVKTKALNKGSEKIALDNFTLTKHYFCVSDGDSPYCDRRDAYHLRLNMYKGTPFYTNGKLGNQNFRFTFFLLAALMVAFGVVIILGELHMPIITTKFTFFYYSFVKGIIYIAIGFLVMGMSNIFGLFVAIYMWIVGILNCVYGWRSVTTFQWNKVGARGTTTIVTRREYI